jgi:hypothetical protein
MTTGNSNGALGCAISSISKYKYMCIRVYSNSTLNIGYGITIDENNIIFGDIYIARYGGGAEIGTNLAKGTTHGGITGTVSINSQKSYKEVNTNDYISSDKLISAINEFN